LLNDATGVHDRDLVGNRGGHAHVVRDQDDGKATLPLQLGQEFEHLGLHGDIERRRRFVSKQDTRFRGERHRDQSSLVHPSAQLARQRASDTLRVW
jgi:hypothetical protein